MTNVQPYIVRMITGTGENIDVPCESISDATEVLDAAEREGHCTRFVRRPGSCPVLALPREEN
jgi:hypothetical protein